MVQLQIISKVIASADNSIIESNYLTADYFVGYEAEYDFIQEHIKQYGNVPDKATFIAKFPDIELVEVNESDRYLLDTIREEYLYYQSVPVVQKVAELLKTDSNAAAEYMVASMTNLQPSYSLGGTDIISQAQSRFDEYKERKEHQDEWFFTTGFEELDDLIHGIQRTEEFMVLFARTNQGKSWILEKICTHIWQIGFNVGYISPEMGASSIGYRFDTLFKNFSNRGLMWGKENVKEQDYADYISELKAKDNKFMVASSVDFSREITVTKLKNWVKQYKLDLLAIDGIKYLTDERYRRGDSITTSLTNISEDLMNLSIELKIPVIVVTQSNRAGVVQDDNGTPELESIRDSDGIAHNASKVISIRQKDNILEMGIKKQRFGSVGGKLKYQWDIDSGDFKFIPSYDDAQPRDVTERKVKEARKKYKDNEDVF